MLDVGAGFDGMASDLEILLTEEGLFGALFVAAYALLPAAALVALRYRIWLAGLPLATWLALTAVAFLYYTTDWWGTVSGAYAGVAFLVLVLAWLVLVAALVAGLRAPPPDAANASVGSRDRRRSLRDRASAT